LAVGSSQATVAELYDSSILQRHHFEILTFILQIEASVQINNMHSIDRYPNCY